MKVALTIILAAALGSASPVGMQARDGQCDCSKPFFTGDPLDTACPAGYKNTSLNGFVRRCTQIGCSEGDFEAQCKANKLTPTPAPPTTATPVAPKEDNYQCDCSKPFVAGDPLDAACLAGYKNTSLNGQIRRCTQIGCSEGDFEAQCKAKTTGVEADETKPATATEANARKLPFIQSGVYGGIYCGMARGSSFQHTDKNCGTVVFCQAFDDQQKMRDYLRAEPQFKNAKDCLDAHEPRLS